MKLKINKPFWASMLMGGLAVPSLAQDYTNIGVSPTFTTDVTV